MRIVIYSDSMARARPDLDEKNKTIYDETYGVLLRKKIAPKQEVDIVHIESLDTLDAEYQVNPYVTFKNPDIVIFHLGINDCAPRIFKKNSFLAKLIYNNKTFKNLTFNIIPRFINKYRYQLTKLFPKTYVDNETFRENFLKMKKKILNINPNCEFYAMSILNASEYLLRKSYGIQKNIDEYNNILRLIFKENYIDVNKIDLTNKHINDGMHFTKEMHNEVFRLVYEKIKEKLKCVE